MKKFDRVFNPVGLFVRPHDKQWQYGWLSNRDTLESLGQIKGVAPTKSLAVRHAREIEPTIQQVHVLKERPKRRQEKPKMPVPAKAEHMRAPTAVSSYVLKLLDHNTWSFGLIGEGEGLQEFGCVNTKAEAIRGAMRMTEMGMRLVQMKAAHDNAIHWHGKNPARQAKAPIAVDLKQQGSKRATSEEIRDRCMMVLLDIMNDKHADPGVRIQLAQAVMFELRQERTAK